VYERGEAVLAQFLVACGEPCEGGKERGREGGEGGTSECIVDKKNVR